MKSTDLARCIDHTLLRADATESDIGQLLQDAVSLGCAAVCVHGVFVARLRAAIDTRNDAHRPALCAVASFPLGAVDPTARAIEATRLAKQGANEIDLVPWLPHVLAQEHRALRDELLQTTTAVRAVRPSIVVKVILETALLRERAASDSAFESILESACAACREAGCDFVKTSTGFYTPKDGSAGGATIEAVQLLRKHASGMQIKASGGIRTREQALAMLDAGADRLGCSSTALIVSG